MISSNKTYDTIGFLESTDKFGGRTYSTSSSPGVYHNFYVANGLAQGDRRSPNSIEFGKCLTVDQRRDTLYKYSGYPSSYFAHDYKEYQIAPWDPTVNGRLYTDRFTSWAPLTDYCLKRIFDQMRYGSGNLVVDLAEARETIRMVKNATSVRRVAKEFMRQVVVPKNYSQSRRLKYTTDKWLEYRYGWLPFVSSTYELLKTLSKKVNKATIVSLEGRASLAEERIVDLPASPHYGGYVKAFNYVKQSNRALLKVRMRGRTTLEIYDFTSLNPAGIAWELVPLSFVADWFVNVGDCLSLWEDSILFANRFVDGFQTLTQLETVKYNYEEHWDSSPPVAVNGQQLDGFLFAFHDSISARREHRYKSRTVLSSLPSPGGVRVDVKLNAKRLLDAASLIRGAFGNPRLK